MKKVFLFLLKRYSHTEEERIEIHKILNYQVYMSNDVIRDVIENNEEDCLKHIEDILHIYIKDAFNYIKTNQED